MIGLGLAFLIGLGIAARAHLVGPYVGVWFLIVLIGVGVSAGQDHPRE